MFDEWAMIVIFSRRWRRGVQTRSIDGNDSEDASIAIDSSNI